LPQSWHEQLSPQSAPDAKHSQYILRQRVFLHVQRLLDSPPLPPWRPASAAVTMELSAHRRFCSDRFSVRVAAR